MPLLAGIDVGGTKLGWSLGRDDGTVLHSGELATDPSGSPGPALDELIAAIQSAAAEPIDAWGVAVPGPFVQPEGRFLETPNLPGWQGFALNEFLSARLNAPFDCRNDANAGALAEWRWGAGQGCSSVIFLTMSTGMGGGWVLNGQTVEGALGMGMEIGHLRLSPEGPVGFGKRGSVEGYLSGQGMRQMAEQERLACKQRSEATRLTASSSTRDLCEAALAGDPAAMRTTARVAEKLGELCALLTDLANPDVIVVGTIGTAYPSLFLDAAMQVVHREALEVSANHVRLVPSGLSDRGHQSALALAAGLVS